jgi:hypothetical protein
VKSMSCVRIGADDEVRTRDIQIGNLKLYQLSYVRAGGKLAARRSDCKQPGVTEPNAWLDRVKAA